MKHKAVEVLVRVQFNIPDETHVKVQFLSSVDNNYEFEVEWYGDEGDYRHQCNLTLPSISFQTQDMTSI